MKITMSGSYQTKHGTPVRILCIDAPGPFPVMGYEVSEMPVLRSWTSEGLYYEGSTTSPLDLFPKPERKKVKIFLNIYADCVAAHLTERAAKENRQKTCIASIVIDREITVGEGLDNV